MMHFMNRKVAVRTKKYHIAAIGLGVVLLALAGTYFLRPGGALSSNEPSWHDQKILAPVERQSLSERLVDHDKLTPGAELYKRTEGNRIDLLQRQTSGAPAMVVRGAGDEVYFGGSAQNIHDPKLVISPNGKFAVYMRPKLGYNELFLINIESSEVYKVSSEVAKVIAYDMIYYPIGWREPYMVFMNGSDWGGPDVATGRKLYSVDIATKQLFTIDQGSHKGETPFRHETWDTKLEGDSVVYRRRWTDYVPIGHSDPTVGPGYDITISAKPDGSQRTVVNEKYTQ